MIENIRCISECNMKKKLIEFLKGIIVGFAGIMPGFSGSIMAVSFNIYDKIIWAFGNVLSKPFQVIKEVWHIVFGGVLGVLMAIISINKLLEVAPIPTILLFTGLIIGSIPSFFKKVKRERLTLDQYIAFFIGIMLILLLSFFASKSSVTTAELDLKLLFILFGLGIAASLTIVVPGMSGTLILLALGYYKYITNFITELLELLVKFEIKAALPNLTMLIALVLGFLFGAITLSKIMGVLLKKYPKTIYAGIFGLLVTSPFAIINEMVKNNDMRMEGSMIVSWIIGIIFLGIGIVAADYAIRYEERQDAKTRSKDEIKEVL